MQTNDIRTDVDKNARYFAPSFSHPSRYPTSPPSYPNLPLFLPPPTGKSRLLMILLYSGRRRPFISVSLSDRRKLQTMNTKPFILIITDFSSTQKCGYYWRKNKGQGVPWKTKTALCWVALRHQQSTRKWKGQS